MNGGPLLPQHGFPLRLVVPGWYGMTSVKWLTGSRSSTGRSRGTSRPTPTGSAGTRTTPARRSRAFPRALMIPPGLAGFPERERTLAAGATRSRAAPGRAGPRSSESSSASTAEVARGRARPARRPLGLAGLARRVGRDARRARPRLPRSRRRRETRSPTRPTGTSAATPTTASSSSRSPSRSPRRVPHACARVGEADRLVGDQHDEDGGQDRERGERRHVRRRPGSARRAAPAATRRCRLSVPTFRSRNAMCPRR